MQPGEHSSVGDAELCLSRFALLKNSQVTDARATMALYHIFHGRWERDLRRAKSRF